MQPICIQYEKTKYGELIIGSFGEKLCLCDWRYRRQRRIVDKRIQEGLHTGYTEVPTEIIAETGRQLIEYFRGERRSFDLELQLVGTPFQQKVWRELIKVPYGCTESYLGLARKLGQPEVVRAVAAANGANAISIIIPCHRIIGSDGQLKGYAGGLAVKKGLLKLESR